MDLTCLVVKGFLIFVPTFQFVLASCNIVCNVIPYIRLFTRHVFSANSTLKPCIKSTRINTSRNHSKSLNLPDLQETVSNLGECIFHDYDILANIAEDGCTRKKTWYTVYMFYLSLLNWILFEFLNKVHVFRFIFDGQKEKNSWMHN